MMQKTTKENSIKVQNIRELSPYSKAIYEAGKLLLNESISTGREFCKFMVTISTSAIPIYLSILTFLLPENYRLDLIGGIIAIIPSIIFLVSTVLFVLGYFPISTNFSLEIINEIERAREATIKRRIRMIKIGFSMFIIAILTSIVVIISNISNI